MEEKIKIIEENIDYNSVLFGNGNAELSEKIRNAIRDLIKTYKETKQDKVHLENLILREYVSKFIIKEELEKAEERYKTYKAGIKENENLKYGMWKHLGEIHMCEKLLGIERNIVTLDTNENTNIIKNDIERVEDYIKHFEGRLVDVVAIGNLLIGYKNLEQENKELSEANTKLEEENTKLNKEIDRMAISIANNNDIESEVCEGVHEKYNECDGYARETHKSCEHCIKKYFREEVENG